MNERGDGRSSNPRGDGLRRRDFLRLAAAAGATGPLLDAAGFGRLALAQAPSAPKKGGTLTVGINTDLVSLDPNDIVFANVPMFFQLYNYLVTFGTSLEPQADLAESWELAKDGTSATFRLRDGVRTHSGGGFDAEALLANFQRIKDKATGGGLFSRLEDFTAADKLDARTVRFRFARPRPDYLAMVSRPGMIAPPAHGRPQGPPGVPLRPRPGEHLPDRPGRRGEGDRAGGRPGDPRLRPEARRGVRLQPHPGQGLPGPGGPRGTSHQAQLPRLDQHAGEPGDRPDPPARPEEARLRRHPHHRRAVALLPALLQGRLRPHALAPDAGHPRSDR